MRKSFLIPCLIIFCLSGCATTKDPGKTYKDPEMGLWNYYKQYVKEGNYTNVNLEYVARNGNRKGGFFATTGFYQGMAIVATCSTISNDGIKCIGQVNYYIINSNAEVIADLSEYELPYLKICDKNKSGPATIYVSKGYEQEFPIGQAEYFKSKCEKSYTKGEYEFAGNRILAYHKASDRFGFLDLKGNVVIPFKYKAARNYYYEGETAAVVDENNTYGIIDINGNFTPSQFACITKLTDKLLKFSYLGNISNFEQDARWNSMFFTSNELKSKTDGNCMDSKVGIVDEHENIIVPADYNNLFVSADTDYIVAQNGKNRDFFKKNGEAVFEDQYQSVIPGKYNFAIQNLGEEWAIGNTKGEFLTEFEYDRLEYLYTDTDIGKYIDSKYIAGLKDGKFTIIDQNGKQQIPPKFDAVSFNKYMKGLIITQLNQKFGVFYDGFELYEPIFDSIGEFKDKRAQANLNGNDYYIFLDKNEEIKYYEAEQKTPPPHTLNNAH